MRRNRLLSVFAVLAVAVGLLQGCSRGPSEEELKLAEFQSQFSTVEESYDALTSLRSEIDDARARLAELEEIPESDLTEEQAAELEAVQSRLESADSEVEAAFEQVQSQLADLLNVGINEYPDSPETAAALVMYSDEAILVARDMVDKAGDYKKAIDHLSNAESYFEAAGLTPYHPLVAEIQELDSWRFITKERFDQVKKGMSKDEVTELVGKVYYRNVQESPSKGVETWLYKKREGGAAAFYFKIKTGKVYDKNFDAVSTSVAND
jgi:hypothetical protein